MIKFLTPAIAERYRGKTCLLRIDLNVEAGAEDVTNRLDAVIPTVQLLLKHNIRVVLLSHRGRPHPAKRGISNFQPAYRTGRFPIFRQNKGLSLQSFVPILSRALKMNVMLVRKLPLPNARVVLLENLRFFRGEESNDPSFAKVLAALGDFHVNDAFAVSHRKNASVVAITKFLPSYGGLRLKEEVERLNEVMKSPKHPFVVVVGGAKVGDKLRSLRGLLRKADMVLLGSSVFAEGDIPNIPRLSFPDDIKAHGDLAWDVGPWTIARYAKTLARARTIIWNGPPGFYEKKGFAKGTRAVWKAVLTNRRARTVIGGGETVASLRQLKIENSKLKIGRDVFISTGGGAMLAYLSGEKLPGIEALK